jgi:hypothetical protein
VRGIACINAGTSYTRGVDLLKSLLIPVAVVLTACGEAPSLRGFAVSSQVAVDCTLTGEASRDCVPEDVLSATTYTSHWVVETTGVDSFSLTMEDGDVLPGITFPNDGSVLPADTEGCEGGGGTCYFARRSEQSVDFRENDCLRVQERVVIFRFLANDPNTFGGVRSDLTLLDQETCPTASVTQVLETVAGAVSEDAAPARVKFPAEDA